MKTCVTIVASSLLGIGVTFLCVPRRELERVPPSRFELPGVPVAVDGQPTPTWEEVNQALRRATLVQAMEPDLYARISGAGSPEFPGREVRITYVPETTSRGAKPREETVIVRPCFPISVPYARAHPVDLVRYETVHRLTPE